MPEAIFGDGCEPVDPNETLRHAARALTRALYHLVRPGASRMNRHLTDDGMLDQAPHRQVWRSAMRGRRSRGPIPDG